ncbi:T-complex 1 subunit delta [Gregarina niphandrodes]|uniref:T-complex 1 subunit delta n=1 Tax=Gregarina niphandrodes TaxID=110365 RepID=A0A023B7Y7_GRENI|nr:T-complex 1 subunit delta [Gregarina niphandrodes]EZG67981.1 T-complex 1 subunit delta [Gregarina niphandrodes]|eukprot:XP_011130130.1 T-complex 1 subunit delta [Gregarina niphandrodes]
MSCRALSLGGVNSLCVSEYAKALEVIPYTLAENAGLRPIEIVTALRNKHNQGLKFAAVDVKKGTVCDNIVEELNIVQPALVSQSLINLATEMVMMLLRVDDVVLCR